MARRRYQRKTPSREYRELFIIATEGDKTEPAYLQLFLDSTKTIRILASRHDSAPKKVLKRAETFLQKEKPRRPYSVWLVLDRDTWQEEVLNFVSGQCRRRGFGLAVSNPCFEYWLLLHFENGNGVSSKTHCTERLVRHLPNFAKGHVEIEKLKPNIQQAIDYARQKDVPPCSDWPSGNGSTVYKLVEALLP